MSTEPDANSEGRLAYRELSLTSPVEEHVVWQREIEPLLAWAPENVRRICEHGFTEMLNNAIDHSGGTWVQYLLEREHEYIRFTIQDNGIGIFEKIRSYFALEDHRRAMLELSKGKLTTDRTRHSGEGIFFTSRMFDKFLIGSNNLGFIHSAGEDDWLVRIDTFRDPGTLVAMEIGIESKRTPKEVFDMFAHPEFDDYSFSRTHVPLKLAVYGSGGLVSRSEAKRVLTRFEGFKEVRLDFEGIESIGQAFADEIFRVFRLAHPEIEVVAVSTNAYVEQMIKRVLSREEVPNAIPLVVPTVKDLLEEIRTGKETRAIIPVPAGKNLSPGDRVTFAEAAFDRFGTPSMIVGGDSVSVTLTKAQETADSYQAMRLFAIGWNPEIGT